VRRDDDLEAASDRRALADMLAARGRIREARETLAEVVAVLERVLGPRHYEVSLALDRLAALAERGGEPAHAAALYERSLAIKASVLGGDHRDVACTARALVRVRARM
jgi:hypothetical protein